MMTKNNNIGKFQMIFNTTDIAYRWFLKINFTDKISDRSAFSQNLNRKFLENNSFKNIFTKNS